MERRCRWHKQITAKFKGLDMEFRPYLIKMVSAYRTDKRGTPNHKESDAGRSVVVKTLRFLGLWRARRVMPNKPFCEHKLPHQQPTRNQGYGNGLRRPTTTGRGVASLATKSRSYELAKPTTSSPTVCGGEG